MVKLNEMPTSHDLASFIKDKKQKLMIVEDRAVATGEVRGYRVIIKEGKGEYSPEKGIFEKAMERLGLMNDQNTIVDITDLEDIPEIKTGKFNYAGRSRRLLDRTASSYHLRELYLPAEEFNLSEDGRHFIRKGRVLEHRIEGVAAAVILGTSIFFSAFGVTGNITGIPYSTQINWIGASLFVLGIAASFMYVKNTH